ncbi:MAG: hypothetical protein H6741_14285 [Alphaproteobacteria bacterium]|nr:hypothetical protein [Alphaproteobacteria bacterium]MCB9793884.1 hypothetical protein [Alphaproteobacteria bacterium]
MPPSPDRTITRWTTRLVNGEPRDIKVDATSGKPVGVANWTAPRGLLRVGHCANCGGPRRMPDTRMTMEGGGVRIPTPKCQDCGLTAQEDLATHQKIVEKLRAVGFVDACERASRTGRHVLALKLATAGFHFGEDIARSRVQRLTELSRLGYHELLREELKAWLNVPKTPTSVALEVAEALVAAGQGKDAREALTEGLRHAPGAELLQLRRAQIALVMGDIAGAVPDVVHLATPGGEHVEPALQLIAKVAEALIADHRASEAVELIDHAAPAAHTHPATSLALARAEQSRGELATARRWYKHALHLNPDNEPAREALREIEDLLGIAGTV